MCCCLGACSSMEATGGGIQQLGSPPQGYTPARRLSAYTPTKDVHLNPVPPFRPDAPSGPGDETAKEIFPGPTLLCWPPKPRVSVSLLPSPPCPLAALAAAQQLATPRSRAPRAAPQCACAPQCSTSSRKESIWQRLGGLQEPNTRGGGGEGVGLGQGLIPKPGATDCARTCALQLAWSHGCPVSRPAGL